MAKSTKGSNISRRRKLALSDGGEKYRSKRDELLRVAADIFIEKGYQNTTLNDVAESAGIDRASVYYYVGSKEEFFHEAVKVGAAKNAEALNATLARDDIGTREKVEQLVRMLMQSYHDSYPFIYVYIQEEMHKIADSKTPWAREMIEKTRSIEKQVIKLIQQGIEEGVFRDDVNPILAVNAVFGMMNWTYRWYTPEGKFSPDEVSDAFCKIFLSGMMA